MKTKVKLSLEQVCQWGRGFATGILISITFLFGSASGAASDYLIGPGDTLRLSIMGLGAEDVEATVELDGSLNLVWLGRVPVSGKTLEEVLDELRELARGEVIKRYSNEGELYLIQLTDDDLFLEIVEYRPIVVSGDVAEPGEIVFRPSLTARRAIALAGGARSALLADVMVTDPIQIVRWQNEYSRAGLENAVALVRLWRLGAEIDGDPDIAPPGMDQVNVNGDVLESLIADQRRIMTLNRQNEAGDRAFLAEAIAQARSRIEILQQQREKALELLGADEAEEERLQGLLESGLTLAARMADIRRSTVMSATRLLDLEESLATAELEVTRLQRELDEYEEVRMSGLLEAREEVFSTVLDTRLLMNLYAQNLSGASGGLGDLAYDTALNVSVEVLRRSADQEVQVPLGLEDALLPGDTLIVHVDQPAEYLTQAN
ncbi:MAG: polysaccharide biosynthesis/export family protein [Paracoccaceae bacterium]